MLIILPLESDTLGLSMSPTKTLKAVFAFGIRLAEDTAIWILTKIEATAEDKTCKPPFDHIHKDNDTV
tara:strand:- start:273 stop:476 length:204 start_codon:yes stop_codon:yes gene_type:complete